MVLAAVDASCRPAPGGRPELLALLYPGRFRGHRMIQALRSGILVLIVPPTLMSVGMIFIVYRNRNRFRGGTADPAATWNKTIYRLQQPLHGLTTQ